MKLDIDIPSGTDEIFDYLRKGGFLCGNHPEVRHHTLYQRCKKYESGLIKMFSELGFGLVGEDDYYSFSDLNETDTDSTEREKKLKAYLPFIDFHIVLTRVLHYVHVGTVFTLSEIEQSVLENISLSSRYKKNNKDSIRAEIAKEVRLFVSNGYVYCTDTAKEQYIVLNSFSRLINFLSLIEIDNIEEVKDEMQKEIEVTEEDEENENVNS
ncbi:MAG: hypothetical protein GQ531_01255 [Sulfurovum sp.]|nr:hypothetical protein [Sulfurovum sp.]